MRKERVGRTAQVNLKMLAELGVPEAVALQGAFQFDDALPGFIPRTAVTGIASVSEILYKSANKKIEEEGNPVIFDLACGYSPRAMLMVPKGYVYIGGDLSNVVDDIRYQLSKHSGYEEALSRYHCVDVTDAAAMQAAIEDSPGSMTVVTQGLLSYLNAEQKHLLCRNILRLLQARGGCWLIPDASPDRMLTDTFRAVLGDSMLVDGIYRFLDQMIHRNRSEINWKNTDEIIKGLQIEGFKADVLPLWSEDLEMRCLVRMSEKQAARLKECWKGLRSVRAYA